MAYEYEGKLLDYASGSKTYEEYKAMTQELQEVYHKAKAFDNYMVDLVKSMETYPHEYEKHANFLKETYDFYMQDKEDFIKGYKDEVRRGYELITGVEEYDRIIKHFGGQINGL